MAAVALFRQYFRSRSGITKKRHPSGPRRVWKGGRGIFGRLCGYGESDLQMRRNKGLSFYRKRKKVNTAVLSEVMKYVTGIAISLFLAYVIVYFVGMRTSVIGVSMEPSLYNGQEVLINRLAYEFAKPKTGDVIVFLPNGSHNAHYYVKRVVACGGDTVWISEGILYVNGEAAENIYDLIADAGIAENEIRLGEDEYFVLGDNCNISEDSRSGNIGPVSGEHIVGKAWFRLPVSGSNMGLIK